MHTWKLGSVNHFRMAAVVRSCSMGWSLTYFRMSPLLWCCATSYPGYVYTHSHLPSVLVFTACSAQSLCPYMQIMEVFLSLLCSCEKNDRVRVSVTSPGFPSLYLYFCCISVGRHSGVDGHLYTMLPLPRMAWAVCGEVIRREWQRPGVRFTSKSYHWHRKIGIVMATVPGVWQCRLGQVGLVLVRCDCNVDLQLLWQWCCRSAPGLYFTCCWDVKQPTVWLMGRGGGGGGRVFMFTRHWGGGVLLHDHLPKDSSQPYRRWYLLLLWAQWKSFHPWCDQQESFTWFCWSRPSWFLASSH